MKVKPHERHSSYYKSGEKFKDDDFDLSNLNIVVSDKGDSFPIKLRDDFLSLQYYPGHKSPTFEC